MEYAAWGVRYSGDAGQTGRCETLWKAALHFGRQGPDGIALEFFFFPSEFRTYGGSACLRSHPATARRACALEMGWYVDTGIKYIASAPPSLPPGPAWPGLAWLCPESHPGTRGRSVGQMERRCREWLACGWGLEERRNVGRTCGGVGGTGSRWIGSRFGMERARARIWGVGDGAWGFLHKQRGQDRDARRGECSQ